MRLVFDIGGTQIRRAVLDGDRFEKLDKHETAGDTLIKRLEALIETCLEAYPIKGVALSFAGQVAKGHILSAPNIALGELAGLDFGAWTAKRFGIQGAIDNDLKCAALAESALRPQSQALAVLYVGTGLGGAWVEKGSLIRGCRNLAGEIGHIPFEKAPFTCGCGGDRCLELFASGSGVGRWAKHLGVRAKTLSDILALEPDNPDAAFIAQNFRRGLQHAVETLAALLNPDTLVLGGGVALNNPEVLTMAQGALEKTFAPARAISIECSTLGDEANLIGAAKLLG